MKLKMIIPLCIAALVLTFEPALAGASEQISLSLRQRSEKGEVVLDILVSNVSTTSVEIVSEGIAPPWSVWAWFDWDVNGKTGKYIENVAGIPGIKESWRIPPGGTILWATIPLRKIEIRTKDGYEIGVKDDNRHVVSILPSERWKQMKVASGKIEVGK
jgi:hypothetical protein